MALNKLRQLDRDSVGITLPKDDIRVEGLLDENGQLEEDIISTSATSTTASGRSNSSRKLTHDGRPHRSGPTRATARARVGSQDVIELRSRFP